MDGYKGRGDCVDPWRELSARAKNHCARAGRNLILNQNCSTECAGPPKETEGAKELRRYGEEFDLRTSN